MKVVDLEAKIEMIIMHLGLRTQKQLTERLGVDPAVIPQWKKNSSQIPPDRLRDLAKLIDVPPTDLANWTGRELDTQLKQRGSAGGLWTRILERASRDLIALRRIDPPPGANRGFAIDEPGSKNNEQEELVHVDERVYLDITVPWNYFKSVRKLELLLLLADDSGTSLMTPQPLTLSEGKLSVKVPEGAPKNRFKVTTPTGRHRFAAIYLDTPLTTLDASFARELDKTERMENAQLNRLANLLLSLDAWSWTIAQKRLFVSRA